MDKLEVRNSLSSFHSKDVHEIFLIGDMIGQGTYGHVFRAKLKSDSSKLFALKKIITQSENDKSYGFPLTAIKEICLLKKLKHKNISDLEEVYVSKPSKSNNYRGSVYLAFKYMDHDLFGMLHSGKVGLELRQVKNILHQILSGLDYLHKNSIIHRDIKSSNILINNKGEVKITDFGLAKELPKRMKKSITPDLVTLWYRAPEVLLGSNNYTLSADIWSLGCIFVELLFKNLPFNSPSEIKTFQQINEHIGVVNEDSFPGVSKLPKYEKYRCSDQLGTTPKLKSRLEKHFNSVTVDLIMRMLEINPNKRITCAEALNHAFFTSDEPMCSNDELPKLDNHYHEYSVRNDDFQKREASKNQSEVKNSITTTCNTTSETEKNSGTVAEDKEKNFLKNKRKNPS